MQSRARGSRRMGSRLARFAWMFAWTFATRRQVVRLWVWTDTGEFPVAVSRFFFYVRRPKLYFWVKRRVSLMTAGQGYVDA